MTKLAFIDTETTGISRPACGLIQLAGILLTADSEPEKFSFDVRPFENDLIEPGALAVSGNSRDSIAAFPEPREVHSKFTRLLARHVDRFDKTDKFWFLAYNAEFDYQHLRSWFLKCNDNYFGSYFWNPPIDIMGLAALRLMDERPNMSDFKLETVANLLGLTVDTDRTHEALYDVLLAKQIFEHCTKLTEADTRPTP